MTNGDYIRSMTDEELAEAITLNMFFNCVICPEDKRLSDNPLEDDACDGDVQNTVWNGSGISTKEATRMSEWISVNDRLPEEET